MSTTSWLNRLAQHNAAHHAAADAHRLALMDVASAGDYRTFLERVYGFEAAVESQASGIYGLAAAAAGARARTGRLHRDLLALGASESEVAALPLASIDLRDLADGLGALVVIERHVLFAGLIRRHLAPVLGDALQAAAAYLHTHPDGGDRIRELSVHVNDSIMRGHVRPYAVVMGIRRAFEAQHYWYGRTSSSMRLPVVRGRDAA